MVTINLYRASLNCCPGLLNADTATKIVLQPTSGIDSITDVTISDVHSRQQHERKRVSVHNTVKHRHNTYV
jgi:hypothetical protein